jgi:3-oxoacyl-[acyl-carrier-protein] synthase-3
MAVRTKIAGIGHYLPERVVTNHDLEKLMDTTNEWIIERTGIEQRRFADRATESTSTMGTEASLRALADAGVDVKDVDFIIFATLSADYFFPGSGVLTQRQLGLADKGIGALDVRNQCSGFIYALTVGDTFIKSGMYKNVLVIGAETHSMGLDFTTRGRDISVIFGDGAGAVLLQPTTDENQGIISNRLHADGREAEELSFICPGSHGGVHDKEKDFGFTGNPYDSVFLTQKMLDDAEVFPYMNGKHVFKYAVRKFPEVIMEVLTEGGYSPADLNLMIPHQANLRISQFVQKTLKLRDDQVFNNIQKYGNTTAASIPIALSEAKEQGRVNRGDLICLAAFGSGFTWGASLLRW